MTLFINSGFCRFFNFAILRLSKICCIITFNKPCQRYWFVWRRGFYSCSSTNNGIWALIGPSTRKIMEFKIPRFLASCLVLYVLHMLDLYNHIKSIIPFSFVIRICHGKFIFDTYTWFSRLVIFYLDICNLSSSMER